MQVHWAFLIAVVLCASGAANAWAHGGGLDGYGCHHNRKTGGYHCHRGPLAGQHFGSKEEMLRQIKPGDGNKRKSAPARGN